MVNAREEPQLPPRRVRRRRPVRALAYSIGALVALLPLFALAAVRGLVPTPVVNAVAGLVVRRQAGAQPWQPSPAAGGAVPAVPGQPVTMLIMGLQVGGASDNPLTDSMMVVSYDPKADAVGILSLPRDLWVTIPGHGEGRINEAFEDGGAALAMLTVQQNLGIPVNYDAVIDYHAFETLIDDVGGVTVDVPYTINDPTFPAPDEIHYAAPPNLDKARHGHAAYYGSAV